MILHHTFEPSDVRPYFFRFSCPSKKYIEQNNRRFYGWLKIEKCIRLQNTQTHISVHITFSTVEIIHFNYDNTTEFIIAFSQLTVSCVLRLDHYSQQTDQLITPKTRLWAMNIKANRLNAVASCRQKRVDNETNKIKREKKMNKIKWGSELTSRNVNVCATDVWWLVKVNIFKLLQVVQHSITLIEYYFNFFFHCWLGGMFIYCPVDRLRLFQFLPPKLYRFFCTRNWWNGVRVIGIDRLTTESRRKQYGNGALKLLYYYKRILSIRISDWNS